MSVTVKKIEIRGPCASDQITTMLVQIFASLRPSLSSAIHGRSPSALHRHNNASVGHPAILQIPWQSAPTPHADRVRRTLHSMTHWPQIGLSASAFTSLGPALPRGPRACRSCYPLAPPTSRQRQRAPQVRPLATATASKDTERSSHATPHSIFAGWMKTFPLSTSSIHLLATRGKIVAQVSNMYLNFHATFKPSKHIAAT
ncbi:hypothetical protein B0H16DRAFT_1448519 [Mycena metata]|uniref:Uncharacterized protein n=1 Tax=Mycena metata TaxID=1033252 RepID=A0AAD7K7V4_9AGAR|nr:hypothetical protein B0H16DRAFT_1448519 [Mycena metata]